MTGPDAPQIPDGFVAVGRIGRPHGVKGEVTVEVRTDDPAARFAVGAQLTTSPVRHGVLEVDGYRRSGQTAVVKFAGVDDRTAAEGLRNALLVLPADDLPETDDDEFYDHQLIGLAVRHVDGTMLGVVADVLHPPASPVLVVTVHDGTDVLVPFVSVIVPEVDVEGGFLVVDPPEGMFGAGDRV